MEDLSIFQEEPIITVMDTMNAMKNFKRLILLTAQLLKDRKEMNFRRPILDLQEESFQQELVMIYFTLQ